MVAAILINGLLITIEDDMPGGWSNPDGSEPPRYVVVAKELGQWLLAIITATCAFVVAFVEPIHGPRGSFDLPRMGIAGGCALLSAGLASRRRAVTTAGALVIVGSALAAAFLGRLTRSG